MMHDQDELIRRLDTLLDVERKALLEGELEVLAEIVEEKEQLIEAFNKSEFAREAPLAPVNEKVQRNQALLEQALSGIRAVAKKMAEIRQARRAFDTYDSHGHKNRIESDASPSVEKRA